MADTKQPEQPAPQESLTGSPAAPSVGSMPMAPTDGATGKVQVVTQAGKTPAAVAHLKPEELLHVIVRDIESIPYEGDATAITSYNEKGMFDVLPFHTNFISIIRQSITITEKTGQKKVIPIEGGILKAFQNTIHIFLGIREFK